MGFIGYMVGARGPSGFGSSSTAEKVTSGVDLSEKVAIVTGASSGLGAETARVLALRGAHVVLAVRDAKAGEKVCSKILAKHPTAKVEVMELDLSSFSSVQAFASAFKAKGSGLNILVNNAGVMMCPFALSTDGHELQFATNHLGHFLLTQELLPVLKASANESGSESRVVIVASMAHGAAPKGGILFDKINDKKSYHPMVAYGQSKLANILHAKELARRLQAEGVTNVRANALCPGGILTKLQRHTAVVEIGGVVISPFLKSIQQGAATSCYLAAHPGAQGVSGKYFYDCNERPTKTAEANDMDLAKQLWEFSEKLVGPSS